MGTSGRPRAPKGAPRAPPVGGTGKLMDNNQKSQWDSKGLRWDPSDISLDPSDISRVLQVSPESFRNFRDSSDIFRFPDVPWIPQDVLGISYPPDGKTFKPVNSIQYTHNEKGICGECDFWGPLGDPRERPRKCQRKKSNRVLSTQWVFSTVLCPMARKEPCGIFLNGTSSPFGGKGGLPWGRHGDLRAPKGAPGRRPWGNQGN